MILVVDDDRSVVASLTLLLERRGYATAAAATPEEALARVAEGGVELVLQDMNFSRATSGAEGLALLGALRRADPKLPVILITAWGSIGLAVEGIKAGAADFITKPWSNAQLASAVETALALAGEARGGGGGAGGEPPSRAELDRRYDFAGLVGEGRRFRRILELVGRVAATDAPVLVTGDSGTGKELIAEAVHRNSRRRDGPFVKVNLGGISSTLFESEMFGHVRGAFTDARADRRGRFEVAHGGTIFLDEIGELEPASQVKLLRVLQDRSYEVLGSSVTRRVDVRVVSATNRDLARMVEQGGFREDLLYRLNLIAVALPPLAERRGDVALLARHFLDQAASAYGRGPLGFSDEALGWLEAGSWPGNVRQLKQAIERAVLIGGRRALPEAGAMTLEEMERAMIVRCLGRYGGNLTRVAAALGLSRAALYRRLRKFGLDPEAARGGTPS
jgi:DNA-binding NtrC family response regulator